MNKIDVIKKFFKDEGLQGTKIFYGSCIEDHLNSKDVDCCIITDQIVDDKFYGRYKQFLIDNNFVIDEEIKYEDKLILTKKQVLNAIKNYLKLSEKVDLINKYSEAVNKLIINIFTTKTKIYDDTGIYKELSTKAWEVVLQKLKSNGGHNFNDFKKIFKVNDQYKKYWGYAPRVTQDLFNRFYQHKSQDSFIRLLKENVINHPYKIAVYSEEKNLTYKDLDDMSDNIASGLSEFKSDYVIVDYPHSFELIPIVYGILKAGKVYVPVDNTSSKSEKDLIKSKFPNYVYLSNINSDIEIAKLLNDSHKMIDYKRSDIAYIIHTSGTTGIPKGVCVGRENLNYILNACQSIAPVSNTDCYLFSTRNTFDVSITEIFGFLYNGGSVFVYSVKSKNFYKKLPQIIKKYQITHIALSPSVLGILLRYSNSESLSQIDNLKYLLIAGEEFKKEVLRLVNESLTKVTVLNVYGPTESTVYATSFNIKDMPDGLNSVPIGKPLPGVTTLIKDNELLIGGAGVSKGYYNDLKRTNEAFEKINGQVFYHTGDIVEKVNGNLIYHGRKDSQVQIYGIRVELGDVRSLISKVINDVSRDYEVLYHNKSLILFYTGSEIPNLRKKLKEKMVSYKVPSKCINVSNFPLTSNGKVDKKALLKSLTSNMRVTNEDHDDSYVYNIVKKSIENILGQEVGIDDDILDLGLDSLTSIELILDLEKKLNLNLDNLNLYSNSSIKEIVLFINNLRGSSLPATAVESTEKFEIQNIPVNRKILYTFPTFFYAKIYKTLNFNSQLYGRIFLGKNKISYEEIYYKLSKVEVFKSILSEDLKEFKVLDTPINISKYTVKNSRINLRNELKNAVDYSIAHHGLLYKFVFVEDENEDILYYSIDHSICDANSLDALERYILGVYDESVPYSEYINETFKHNTVNKALMEIDNFNKQDNAKVSKVLSEFEDKVNVINLTYLDSNVKNIYAEILILLKTKLLEKYKLDNLKVNLIYNIRKFSDDLDFSSTIGDLHLGLTYLLQKDSDVAKKLDELILQYKKEMFNPKAIGYRNFPHLSSDDKKIINCFDDSVYISIDYLGIVSKEEFEQIWQSSSEINHEINKLNGTKLNITAYIVDNELKLISSKVF